MNIVKGLITACGFVTSRSLSEAFSFMTVKGLDYRLRFCNLLNLSTIIATTTVKGLITVCGFVTGKVSVCR